MSFLFIDLEGKHMFKQVFKWLFSESFDFWGVYFSYFYK